MEGWETGGCYVIRVSALISQGNRYPYPTGTISIGFLETLDIDTPLDLANARAIQIVMDNQGVS